MLGQQWVFLLCRCHGVGLPSSRGSAEGRSARAAQGNSGVHRHLVGHCRGEQRHRGRNLRAVYHRPCQSQPKPRQLSAGFPSLLCRWVGLTDTASVAKGQEDQQFRSLPKVPLLWQKLTFPLQREARAGIFSLFNPCLPGCSYSLTANSFHIVSGTAPPYLS